MDMMQGMLRFIKIWLTSMRKIAAYLQESFLPDSDSKGESQGIIWWF